jgi:hypothetical protein
VALTIYDAVRTSGGLPRDFALEIAPYWLWSHPTLTFDEYKKATVLQQLVHNATLSAATVSAPAATSTPGYTDFGIGLRTQVFISFATQDQNDAIDAGKAALTRNQQAIAIKVQYQSLLDEIAERKCDPVPEGKPECTVLLKNRDALAKQLPQDGDEKALTEASKALQAAEAARSGLVVSVAGALSGRTPDGEKVSWKEPKKGAAWLNLGYSIPSFDLLGVGRYIRVDQAGDLVFSDLGARVDWTQKQFELSVEYLRRFLVTQPDGGTLTSSTRLTGTLRVIVSNGVSLSATFGQDAANESRPAGFLTLLGLSFQTSPDRTLKLM